MTVRQQLKNAKWQFAKSMPNIPHEYTLRETWERDEDFDKAVLFIREYGYEKKFYGKTFTYYEADGYKYWTMGAPIYETILINREKL